MPHPDLFLAPLLDEHNALWRSYGAVQQRCSRVMAEQRADIARLEGEVTRLRARALVTETALAWEREDHAALRASIRSLPRRGELARSVQELASALRQRMWGGAAPGAAAPQPMATAVPAATGLAVASPARATVPMRPVVAAARRAIGQGGAPAATFDPTLAEANRVICQTACLSHGAYWREDEQCRRSGQACLLPGAPATALPRPAARDTEAV